MMTHLLQSILELLKVRPRAAVPIPSCRPPIAHPLRDWTIVGFASASVLLLLLGTAAVLYVSTLSSSIPGASPAQSAGFNTQKLQDTLTHYRAAAAEHSRLLSSAPPAADPAR